MAISEGHYKLTYIVTDISSTGCNEEVGDGQGLNDLINQMGLDREISGVSLSFMSLSKAILASNTLKSVFYNSLLIELLILFVCDGCLVL